MPMNTPTFEQVATVLSEIVGQATGREILAPVDSQSFVAVAKIGLETGYDALSTAISTVLSKTIFSIRPYQPKFKGLYADAIRYGNHVRKLTPIDGDFEEDNRIKLTDGQSIDMYTVNKPKVLQTNFYGESLFQKHITIYKDQLDTAFSGPEQFASFLSMIMTQMTNEIEQGRENMARAALANYIAGKTLADADNVIYLLDEYDTETGETSTATSIKAPENFAPFAKWLFAKLRTYSDLMTERSIKFHQNFVDSNDDPIYITRHTPLANQKLYLYAPELNNIDASVLSGAFHDEYLKVMDHERVNFWQSINNPTEIEAFPGYTDEDGKPVALDPDNDDPVELENVFGVLFDEEAVGYTSVNEWAGTTPLNANGLYYNWFYHTTFRYWNDFTENGIVLILDHAPEEPEPDPEPAPGET